MTPLPVEYRTPPKRKRVIDRVGDVYGRLTVIKFHGYDKHNRTLWLCRCECGEEAVKGMDNLRNGNIRSCGCLQRENREHPPSQKGRNAGVGIAGRNAVLWAYKRSARDRGFSWGLTVEQATELFQGNCYYCGCESSQYKRRPGPVGGYKHNGIDRLDSTKGYEMGNVVPCCNVCNVKKSYMSELQFYVWIEKVYTHLSRKGKIPVLEDVPPFDGWMGRMAFLRRSSAPGSPSVPTV